MSSFRRFSKRRRALHDAVEEEIVSASTSYSATSLIFEEKCNAKLCGEEAACQSLNSTHSKCVCPHDGSMPTKNLLCPSRRTVPINPQPISNIKPPSGGNLTIPNATSTEQAKVETTPHNWANRDSTGLLVGSAVAVVLVVLVGFTLCLWKRKEIHKCLSKSAKNRKPKNSPCPLNLTKGLLVAERYRANPQYTACAPPSDHELPPVPLLARDKLFFLQVIGEGCFGKVYKGELTRVEGHQPEVVAIKELKDTASREAEEDFMREVDIMSGFKHSNILSLIGVVTRADSSSSPLMVFEFMPHGDLAEVLRRNSRQLWNPIPGLSPLTKESLLLVAVQIAAGMRYLAGERFVHRDLACRNCLVGTGLTVKIADFGMSRDIYVCDYYKIGGSRLLPVRWMAPESVTYGRFTLESDVWSYGVILWEIYSLGKQPYYGHSNDEVIKLIIQGIMLIPPDDCPPFVCDLMRSCWKTEPRDRIRFHEIHERLQKAWGRAVEAPDNVPITQPPPQRKPTLSTFKPNNPLPFPRPPGTYPVAQFRPVELLDRENYLLPASPPASRVEYLETLPDLEVDL